MIELSKNTRLQISKISFPLSEELEFNLRNGHSSIRIKDCNSNTLLVADITTGSVDWSCTSLYKLIDTNALIKRKLYKAFSWLYTGHIPFTADDLSPRNAVAMTRFRGFSRIFYDSIPYDLTDGMIDSSFNALAREIRTENDLPGILKRSSIPNTKSIKRTMFSNPGLFFYISELEKMWEILDGINSFLRILESRRIFFILPFLHQYPGSLSFLSDYRTVKSASCLFSLMNTRWDEISSYSTSYCSMSSTAKEKERKRWKNTKLTLTERQHYSIPIPTVSDTIRDCSIDGFFFEWLRTKRDYIRAGNTLNNCLKDWTPISNPVVVIKRNSRVVAAVEILDNMVIQARAAHNMAIEHNGDLYVALEKWKAQYSLIDIPDYCLLDNFED